MSTLGLTVNYYWKPGFAESTRASALLALRMLREGEDSPLGTVLLVDGSPSPDPWIRDRCGEAGARYHHAGRELTFAQGYNTGWRLLPEPIVGLMASDIFAPRGTLSTLSQTLAQPGVGCVFPYLSACDYPGQVLARVRRPITCEPTAMTLNLNLFRREVLEAVGGVDEGYTGGYNDVILLMKIRRAGHRVVQVGGTHVTHLGQVTVSQGTCYRREADRARFAREYGEFHAPSGKWNLAHWKWPLATSRRAAAWWWWAQNAPAAGLRARLQAATLRREPELTRFPAPWGAGRPGASHTASA